MRCIYVILLCLLMFVTSAQESQFSQYFSTTSFLNPAFTGAIPNMTLNTNYKRAGDEQDNEYQELIQTTFTYPFRKFTSKFNQVGGAGITFFKESRGAFSLYQSTKILLNGAYTMRLSRLSNKYLIFGLQGGIVQQKIGQNLRWGSQFSRYLGIRQAEINGHEPGYDDSLPGEIIGEASVFYPIFNFGVIYTAFDNANFYIRDKTLTVGLSIDNLNRPSFAYDDAGIIQSQKFWLVKTFGSAKMELGPRWYIYPSAFVAYSQGNIQVNAGTYFSTFVSSIRSKTAVMLQTGTWYRVGDSIIGMLGVQVENIKVGFSVDLNSEDFGFDRAGDGAFPTYEISMALNLNTKSPLGNVSSPIF
ncbi:MAG: PorP/SprF family type IX secretion system membrane protein [Cyclobacteriaceae bacterium]|nr:PorP/SprF family type IX secretion system membrane protein [Cyclobacteriaceae bacterium SS2]